MIRSHEVTTPFGTVIGSIPASPQIPSSAEASPLDNNITEGFGGVNLDVHMEGNESESAKKKKRYIADATDPIEVGKCSLTVLKDQMEKRLLVRMNSSTYSQVLEQCIKDTTQAHNPKDKLANKGPISLNIGDLII